MRIRTVKPEFFKHEDLFLAEQETEMPLRVAFVGLWCASDRDGRFKWRPRQLGIDILPYDDIEFSLVLDALTTRGFIVKYRVKSEWFGAIPSFKRHQIVNPRERASEIPDVTAAEALDACVTREPRDDHACRKEGKGREGKGTLGDVVEEPPPASSNGSVKLTDEQWLEALKSDVAYDGIDVGREYAKMLQWCAVNHKKPSRRRFVNWVNRAEPDRVPSRQSSSVPFLSPEPDIDLAAEFKAKQQREAQQ